jgi:hypothetical protein
MSKNENLIHFLENYSCLSIFKVIVSSLLLSTSPLVPKHIWSRSRNNNLQHNLPKNVKTSVKN